MYYKEFLGCWHIKDILDKEESIYSDKQLKKFLRRPICLNKATAMMLIDTLHRAHYFFKRVDAQNYLWNNLTSTKHDFGITADSLTVIKIKGIEISKNTYPTEYELFYDGRYLFLFEDTDANVTSVTDVTKVITGGRTGLADRITYFGRASAIIPLSKSSGIGLFGIF